MRKTIEGLYERFRAHHEMDHAILQWFGAVGFFAYPLFYLLRSSAALATMYDDLHLRIVASALCLLVALRRFWPERLKRFFVAFSYLTAFYSLAFLLSFTMLKNQGGTPSVVNMVFGALIIILLADWRNSVVMLLSGYALSIAVYAASAPVVRIPPEFVMAASGCILVVIAGAVSHYGQKRVELERMRRVYSGLAGSIAHEVRTPLSQVQHTLELVDAFLRRAGSGAAPAAAQELAEVAQAVAQGRHAVARGLQSITLTLQQLHGRAIESAGFTLLSAAETVEKALNEYAFESDEERGRVTLQVAEDFSFRGEETVFVLVLFNLLKNALYYVPSHPNARITIAIERAPVPRVVVRDTGPGIAAERIPHLFEEFRSQGKSQGTGLGLAFCRRAMQAFGGDLACVSRLGEFTEFTLSFPVAQPQPAQVPPATEPPARALEAALAGHTVLVVDDSAFNRAIVKARLNELGMQAIEAHHGGEALRMIDDGARPAAILMDLEMPGIGGLEATRALRGRPGPAGAIPVLALSANDLPSWREAALAVGTNGYLTKPLQPEVLASELARVLALPLAVARPA